jgi:hypothetical protein
VTAVDERLIKPLRSGNRLAIAGLLIVLLALVLDPAARATWMVNVAGVAASTWGAIQATTWLAHLRGRRSLTEAAVGIALVGGAAAMTIITAQGPQDRENSWLLGISAIGFALLGLALVITSAVDHRGERRIIENPPPPPAEGAITKPQHPGVRLALHESQLLRLTLAVTAANYVAIVIIAFLR